MTWCTLQSLVNRRVNAEHHSVSHSFTVGTEHSSLANSPCLIFFSLLHGGNVFEQIYTFTNVKTNVPFLNNYTNSIIARHQPHLQAFNKFKSNFLQELKQIYKRQIEQKGKFVLDFLATVGLSQWLVLHIWLIATSYSLMYCNVQVTVCTISSPHSCSVWP